MSDKKPKLKLPPGSAGKLQGFEDVIDIFIEEQESAEREKNKKDHDKYSANHEVFDFLEKEKKRLQILDKFFAEKIPIMTNNPQIDLLVKKQRDITFFKRDEVIKAIKAPKSDFQNSLARIFDQSFGQGVK